MESVDWFYVRGDDELGPFSGEHLQELLARGEIGPRTLIRKRTWMDWREAGTLDFLPAEPFLTDSGDAASSPPIATDGKPVEPTARLRPRARLRPVATILASLLIVATVAWSLSTRFKAGAPATQEAEAPGTVAQAAKSSSQLGWLNDPIVECSDLVKVSEPARSQAARQSGGTIDWEKELAGELGPPQQQPQPATPPPQGAIPPKKTLDPVTLYAQSKPAVATIRTKDDSGYDAGQGSGFFIPRELVGARYRYHELTEPSTHPGLQHAYLLTNFHVIRSAADAEVRLNDGRIGFVSDVVMEQESADLAVVSVFVIDGHSKPTKPVKTLPIADGPEPPVGERVYAIGSPKGLDASLSEGIVSGRREGNEESPGLQFTAPVSPGSSGGPLLNATGQVVGVVTALRRGGQNLNFAVPASEVVKCLMGPINSRDLWRGSGINGEEHYAYLSANFASRKLKKDGKVSGEFLEFLSKGKEKIGNETYGRRLESLAPTAVGQMGEWEYLLHFTIGRFAVPSACKTEGEAHAATNSFSAKVFQSIARANKDEQLAEKSLAEAIRLKPEFSPSYLHLAESLQRQGRFAEALKLAEQLLQRVPRCGEAYRLRGGCYAELDRDFDALTDFKMAAELGPSDPYNYRELGRCYAALRENEKAIEAYEAAIRLFPPKSVLVTECYWGMSACYERMGKVEQANACLEKAKRPVGP